jgi:5-methylcytosine-specific restriction endonuclease McrA
MQATEEVSEYLRGWKACEHAHVHRLQRQKFLLETRLAAMWDDRRKWLEGTDNAALREQIATLKDQLKAKDRQISEITNRIIARVPPAAEKSERVKTSICFYCNQPVEHASCDHFIPSSKGGQNWKLNKVAACKPCNGKKGQYLPTEEQIRKYFALWKHLGIDLTKFIENDTTSPSEVSDSCV